MADNKVDQVQPWCQRYGAPGTIREASDSTQILRTRVFRICGGTFLGSEVRR